METRLEQDLRLREEALGSKDHPAVLSVLFSFIELYQMWSEDAPQRSFDKGSAVVERLLYALP